jgi:hypothetical protein
VNLENASKNPCLSKGAMPTIGTDNAACGYEAMPRYTFTIANGESFSDTSELPDDQAAWSEALRTMKDVDRLQAGGSWTLVVYRGDIPIYRILVRTEAIS